MTRSRRGRTPVADADIAAVIARVRADLRIPKSQGWRSAEEIADLEAICTAADQSAKLREELAQMSGQQTPMSLAEYEGSLDYYQQGCERLKRERDAARAEYAENAAHIEKLTELCSEVNEENAALKAECERLRGAMRRISDANPGASLHCDTAKERSAFDYGYRSACQRLVDTIAAEEIKAPTEAQLRAGREG